MALGIASCSPLKVIFKAYPGKFDRNESLKDQLLRAFALTVVPGADQSNPNLIRIFRDDVLPFPQYLGFFTSDLAARCRRMFGTEQFETISQPQREQVISSGLQGDAVVSRLYRGAVLMAKASIYAGIYDDNYGCPHIDYHGRNNGFSEEELFYRDAKKYFATNITTNGNAS